MHHVPQAGLTKPAVAGQVDRGVRRHFALKPSKGLLRAVGLSSSCVSSGSSAARFEIEAASDKSKECSNSAQALIDAETQGEFVGRMPGDLLFLDLIDLIGHVGLLSIELCTHDKGLLGIDVDGGLHLDLRAAGATQRLPQDTELLCLICMVEINGICARSYS